MLFFTLESKLVLDIFIFLIDISTIYDKRCIKLANVLTEHKNLI